MNIASGRMRANSSSKENGFTIVELLIVIVVIAIMAAITTVAYNGIQNRAHNSAVQSDLKNSYRKLLQHQITSGSFPATTDHTSLRVILTASKTSYDTAAHNAYLYCRTDQDAAVVGLSKSGIGYYYGTQGSGTATWADANATLCPRAGIQTTAPGYGFYWFEGGSLAVDPQWTW